MWILNSLGYAIDRWFVELLRESLAGCGEVLPFAGDCLVGCLAGGGRSRFGSQRVLSALGRADRRRDKLSFWFFLNVFLKMDCGRKPKI